MSLLTAARDEEQRRDERLAAVRDTVATFVADVARAIAGHDVDFAGSATAEVANQVRRAIQQLISSSLRAAPDFGQFAELRVEGDLLRDDQVRCVVRLQDRSSLVTDDRRRVRQFRRTVQADAIVALDPCRVVECSFSVLK